MCTRNRQRPRPSQHELDALRARMTCPEWDRRRAALRRAESDPGAEDREQQAAGTVATCGTTAAARG